VNAYALVDTVRGSGNAYALVDTVRGSVNAYAFVGTARGSVNVGSFEMPHVAAPSVRRTYPSSPESSL
jgi:hypothetical protein